MSGQVFEQQPAFAFYRPILPRRRATISCCENAAETPPPISIDGISNDVGCAIIETKTRANAQLQILCTPLQLTSGGDKRSVSGMFDPACLTRRAAFPDLAGSWQAVLANLLQLAPRSHNARNGVAVGNAKATVVET